MVKVLVVFAVIAILFSAFGGSNDSDIQKDKSGATAQAESKQNADTKPDSDEELSGLSLGQKNALASAKNYLSFTAFSRDGLIHQLEYEQYSTEDAIFAVDNCGADWNEQAAKKAQQYLDMSAFSRADLVDQLLYEGFTAEQAEYGVTAAGY